MVIVSVLFLKSPFSAVTKNGIILKYKHIYYEFSFLFCLISYLGNKLFIYLAVIYLL